VISGKVPDQPEISDGDFRARRIQGIVLSREPAAFGIDGIQECRAFVAIIRIIQLFEAEQTDGRGVRDGQLTNAVFHRIHACFLMAWPVEDQLIIWRLIEDRDIGGVYEILAGRGWRMMESLKIVFGHIRKYSVSILHLAFRIGIVCDN